MTAAATRRTVLAGGTTLLAGRAAAQQATTLRLYTFGGFLAEPAMLALEVPRRTGGRYRIEQVLGFDKLEAVLGKERAAGGERALFEGARSGELDLVVCSALPLGDYVPEAQALFVPFLFRDYAHARTVLDGPVGQNILARCAARGLAGLAWSEDGLRHTINAKRPIRTPEDLRGLRLRTPQHAVFVEAFRALGAEVVPMPWGKALLDALARGALDGAEATVRTIWDFEVFRSQRYLSLTGHIYVPAVIVMSEAAYDRLSEADRQAFAEAARLAGQNGREDNDNMEVAGVADLLGVGVQINADVDKAAFRAALGPAYVTWRERFGDLIDRIQAYG